AQGDLRHELLEAPTSAILTRLAQVRVDHRDALRDSSQSERPLHQGVLVLLALPIVLDLARRRLADSDVGAQGAMRAGDLLSRGKHPRPPPGGPAGRSGGRVPAPPAGGELRAAAAGLADSRRGAAPAGAPRPLRRGARPVAGAGSGTWPSD